jgi:hypothetical protein
MEKSTSFVKKEVVSDIFSTIFGVKSEDPNNFNARGSNEYHKRDLLKKHSLSNLALASVYILTKLDKTNELYKLKSVKLDVPRNALREIFLEASKDPCLSHTLFCSLIRHIGEVSIYNILYLEAVKMCSTTQESDMVASMVRELRNKSFEVAIPLFEILIPLATPEDLPILEMLAQDIENDKAFSKKSDVRAKFAAIHKGNLSTLLEALKLKQEEASLFASLAPTE